LTWRMVRNTRSLFKWKGKIMRPGYNTFGHDPKHHTARSIHTAATCVATIVLRLRCALRRYVSVACRGALPRATYGHAALLGSAVRSGKAALQRHRLFLLVLQMRLPTFPCSLAVGSKRTKSSPHQDGVRVPVRYSY
jgi:hypothetical protein